MQLLRSPGEPRATALYLFGAHLNENEVWEPFLRGW